MRHHYVPRFYLRLFVDPNVPFIETDYLWECHLPTGTIKRGAPKNVAARTDYYKVPGVPDEIAQTVEASRYFSSIYGSSTGLKSMPMPRPKARFDPAPIGSPHPPAPAGTAGSSGRAPWR